MADKAAGQEGGGTWIGRSVKRREDECLLAGKGQYVADVELPGALHVAVLRSTHAHARIVRLDVSAAEQLAGVTAVWTAKDVAERINPLAPFFWREPPQPVQERSKPVLRYDEQPLLADTSVRYVGEPIALVVAGSRYLAEDALEAIDVEYELLPALGSAEQALAPGAPLLNPDWGDNVAVAFTVSKGDAAAAFRNAKIAIKERLRSHRYTSIPMETRGVSAMFDADTGQLTVWSSTQVPHGLRDILAERFQLPQDQVRCIAPDVGGGFGVKGMIYAEDILVPLLARELKRPVRWVEDRREHFLASTHAREQIHDVEIAAGADGRILAFRDDILVDQGAYSPTGLIGPYNTVAHLFGMYDIPSCDVRARAVMTNKTPHAPYRGAGRSEAVFAMERMIERVAAELGLDPAEVRLRNLVPAGAMPFDTGLLYRDGQPLVYDSGDYPHMFRRALELLDYDRWRREQAQAWTKGRCLGIGLASYVEGTGIGPFESASVAIDPSGQVRVATGSASQGQGHATTFAQIAAEVLDVPIEQIEFTGGDTGAIASGFGTIASRSIVNGGMAVANAAGQVRAQALQAGAELLEAPLEDIELTNGQVRVKGSPKPALTLYDIAAALANLSTQHSALSTQHSLSAEALYSPPGVTYSGGVDAAVVEVDPDTGRVEVLRLVVVHDCGHVVNPTIVEGQMMGGTAQGIGGALYEELKYDEGCQLLTTSFMDYLLPTAMEVPDVTLDHQEYPTFRNALGVKGLGEGGAIPVPALIANAVEDALRPFNVVVRETPLSPQNVRRLIA